ncbi:hypothetical protein TRFO_23812 [Tritrichomonas foetus]|uniref:Uncharacterized protein n=1 Tax=Tritrichomonas foetus TaxID=1144522 RepID=A0A1J4K8Y0_9EUKA|nr:hypothetical protein TRFO_23812 [Tritrichomonas foetus]|eukprot:OHT07863.1 hypothetical protein TRFO_23812 [Tritrichomonas foetus]
MKSHDSCLLISLPLAECNVGTSALIQRSSSSDKISLENDKSYDLLKKPSKTDNSGNSYDLNSSKNMNFESFFVNENEKSLLNCSFSLVDAKNQVTELMKSTNADYLTETLKRMDAVNALKNISLQLQTIKMKEDVHLKRESIKMNIAFFNYCEEYSEAELARIHNNIFMYGSFINFLLTTTLKDCLVNIQAFLTKYIKLNKNFYKHSKRCIVMKSKFDMPLKSMTKKGSIKRKQEIFDLLSESRKSGRIIQRLKLQADLLSYYDIDIVVMHY